MSKGQFKKSTKLPEPVEDVFSWHLKKGAFERLSPPWDIPEVIKKVGTIKKNDETFFKMKVGPIPIKWHARHTDYEENALFRDVQVKGPFSSWTHTHRFEKTGDSSCIMHDIIDYELPISPVTGLLNKPFVEKKLDRIFTYRHQTLANDLAVHQSVNSPPLNIVVSGASGSIGSILVPFFTTGGHHVKRLVRRKPISPEEEIFWDPAQGKIDREALENADIVIHLAGENIGEGRWHKKRKKSILESRTKGTKLLAEALSQLKNPPKAFISASAIGYYGDCEGTVTTEECGPGCLYISQICEEWEDAAAPAEEKGIRTVFMRIGIVATPAGGALEKLVLPFQMGLGAKFGEGNQYMSWISPDDVLYAFHHVIFKEDIEGPMNIVSPNPVTNKEFTETLAQVLNRPAVFTMPEKAIDLIFGQMGREVLIAGARVMPEKLLSSGYRFRFPDLKAHLRHILGLNTTI